MEDEKTLNWRELCAQAAVEQDPTKLLSLVTEINRQLSASEAETRKAIE
jgi:hypothetical protein